GLHLAAADLVGDVGLGGEGFVDGGEEGRVVGDDLEAAFLDDLVGVSFAVEDAVDDLAGEFVGEFAGADEFDDACDLGRGDGQVAEFDLAGAGVLVEVLDPPAAGVGLAGACVDGGGDEVDGAGVDEVAEFLVGQVPVVLDAFAAFPGHLGDGGAQLFDPFPGRCDGGEVVFGDVPEVLGGLVVGAVGGVAVGYL